VAANQQTQQLYEFGPFRIDRLERVLLRDGEVVALTPKVFDILLILVENTGHIVEKDKLMNEVWPDSFVEEGNLTQNVSTLRKALADGAESHAYIQTIARRGYRFVGNVREVVDEGRRPVLEERSNSHLVVERVEATSVAVKYSPEAEQAIREKGITVRVGEKRASRMRLSTSASVTWVVVAGLSVALCVWIWKKPRPIESSATVRTIAVLPFKPLVADARNESLELGMAETLINKLSSIREIIVRPISAVRRYTDLNQDPLAAGRELGVDAVLDASIQWEGENKIRVAARLLRVGDGSTIWTDKCDKQCSNIFELQDSIAERVAGALSLKLTDDEIKQLSKRYTENTAAYQLYLNGFFSPYRTGARMAGKHSTTTIKPSHLIQTLPWRTPQSLISIGHFGGITY
jgi:DNA-binding winged helix-turn-helix (wHTH) protein/TolB-like protein